MTEEVGRRRLLGAVGASLACGLAGCAGARAGGGPSVTVTGDGPCVEGFRVVEEAARVASGWSASVRLRFENGSDVPLSYDVRVAFERATWIGNTVQNGEVTLDGTLAAGESVVRTAAPDEPGGESTGYEVAASVTCEAA